MELDTRPINYRPRKDLNAEWETFKKGLNLLLRPTELQRDEYAQGDNIMLVGSGVPTGRWGTSTYFTVNATGAIRGFGTYNNLTSLTNELIALSDEGFLAKKNGTSSTVITGQSYPSGSIVRSAQLGGYAYFVNKDTPFTRYNGTTLDVFSTLSVPTGLYVTNISGASGPSEYSWKVVTIGTNGGHTQASANIVLGNLPQDLSLTQINLSWSAPSAAASMINGYEVYRGQPGDETFIAGVNASVTRYTDFGVAQSDVLLAPTTNTTGGVKSPVIAVVGDRLLMVDANDKTKLLISARYPMQSSFNFIDGGGYVYIGPDDGQEIIGIEAQPGSNAGEIIIFKNYSSYAVRLNTISLGNYVLLDPTYQPVSTSVGASNPDTIQRVENDIFYFGRKGLYVVGYEPNFLNIIRTNEISARIRPYLQLLSDDDYTYANAMYVDNKYILSFPNRKEMIVYDRERGCFTGVWKMPFGISHMKKYVDGTGTERWVLGSAENNQVYTFERSINSDNGTTIVKTLLTNKEAFNSWSLLKILKLFYILFRNITGDVNVNIIIEDRNGTTSTAKTFTISGAAVSGRTGWGASKWGSVKWGMSKGSIVTTTDELKRWGTLYKQVSLVQLEISCTAAASNFELLKIKMTASAGQEGSLPASLKV